MSNLSEEIKVLEEFIEEYNASYPDEKEWVAIYPNQIQAIQGLLDLYNKEKDLNNELQIRYNIEHEKYLKEKEKNKKLEEDNEHLLITGARQVAQIDLEYISKDKIREKMKQIERGFPKETMFSKEFLILDLQELLED